MKANRIAMGTAAWAVGLAFLLRRPSDVVEAFGGKAMGKNTTRFTDTILANRTRVYFLGDAAAWQGAMQKSRSWLDVFRSELSRLRKAKESSQPR